jgi:hypothetical protein
MAQQITAQAQGLIQAISQKSGSPAALSSGWHNELIASELLPRFAYLVLAGVVFHGCLTAAGALVAAGTAAGPLTLFNPVNSTVNLLLINANVGLAAVPTAGANEVTVQLATTVGGTLSSTTPGGNTVNALIGSTKAPSGSLLTAATISAASKPIRNLGYLGDVATTSVMLNGQIEDPIDGAIIVGPGGFVTLNGLGTTPGNFSVAASLTWAELPV